MKKIVGLLRTGPLMVAEVRGTKAETAKRFDKSDKNAAPQEFGLYKVNLELLADGASVMLSVFLDVGIKPDEFAAKANLKRGDVIAVAVTKLDSQKGVRRAYCRSDGFGMLDKSEADQFRS